MSGWDIGNQTSLIACIRKGTIETIANEASSRLTPTMVAFTNKTRYAGESALTQQMSNIKNTITQVKRLIGRKYSEVADEIAISPFVVVEEPNDEIGIKVQYANETLVVNPIKVLAIMLVKLKNIQEKEGGRMTDVVLSVPSWFNDRQRRAMSDAAEIAGINCLRFINENTATALGYGFYKLDLPETEPMNVLFVDIGHSATSASVVAFTKGKLKVISQSFNSNLGGRNIDAKLVSFFADEFAKKYSADVRSNPKSFLRLTTSCEKLKKDLCSGVSEARMSIENLMNDLDVSTRMTRVDFEELIKPELSAIAKVVSDAIADSKIDVEKLHSVEVVGGTKRMPPVQAIIRDVVKRDLSFTLNDVESVARGCAIMCAIVSPGYKVKEFSVVDYQPYPIHLSWSAVNKMSDATPPSAVLFMRGSTVPSSKLLKLSELVQYELVASYDASASAFLPPNAKLEIGKFITSEPPTPSNESKIEVQIRMRVNPNGILTVESADFIETYEVEEAVAPEKPATPVEGETPAATETAPVLKKKKKSKTTKLTVTETTPSLSKAEINDAIEKEGYMQSQDKLTLETAEAKNAVEAYCLDIRSRITGELAAYGSQKEKDELTDAANNVENWLYEDGYDETKGVYAGKLLYLQQLGNVFYNRRNEEQKRLAVVMDLHKTINHVLNSLNDEKYSHIEQSDKDQISNDAAAIRDWLTPLIEKQKKLTPLDEPAIKSADVLSRKILFEEASKKILSKPKPAPAPTPAPAPEATPQTETAESAETAGNAETAGTAEKDAANAENKNTEAAADSKDNENEPMVD